MTINSSDKILVYIRLVIENVYKKLKYYNNVVIIS